MTMMHHRQIRYIGLDVHKATISVAIAEESDPPTSYGKIANDPSAIRKLMTRLGDPQVELRVAYEAGPTGYALHRQLTKMSIDCSVVAPSLAVDPGRLCVALSRHRAHATIVVDTNTDIVLRHAHAEAPHDNALAIQSYVLATLLNAT